MYDVSIIVPIYNVGTYLEKAIKSLIQQVEFSYEIVLVDDGSIDNSNEICKKYSDFENIQILIKENGGLVSARKAGLDIARGKYIAFLDGDDWVEPDYYYRMINTAKDSDADVVCSSYVSNFPKEEKKTISVVEDGFYTGKELNRLREKILYSKPYYTFGIVPSLCMKMIKRDLIVRYLYKVPNNITIAEDATCSYPVMFNCDSIYVLHNNDGYHYRQFAQSMTRRYDQNKMMKVITAINYFDEAMQDKYHSYEEQIDNFFLVIIKDFINNEIKSGLEGNVIANQLKCFRENEVVETTLQKQYRLPFLYAIEFDLYRKKKFRTLVRMLKLYQLIRGNKL